MAGEDRGPQPTDDDGDEPQPKSTDSLTALVNILSGVHEGAGDGKDERNDNPGYGCRRSNCPGVGFIETSDETSPPIVVLGENYEGCE